MAEPLRRRLLAAVIATLAPAPRVLAYKEPSTMSDAQPDPIKVPQPPQSKLDLEQHVLELRFDLGAGLTGQADRDFAVLLQVQQRGLAQLAALELRHGQDRELRELAQRIVDGAAAQDALLKGWLARNKK